MSELTIREFGTSDAELEAYVALVLASTPAVWDHTLALERWWEGLSGPQLRFAIEDATGAVVGFASATGLPVDPDSELYFSIHLPPAWRGRGARSQALRLLDAWAMQQRTAPRVRTSVDTSELDERAWWEQRGFAEKDRHVITELDLRAGSSARTPPPVEGIEFTTLAARPDLLRAAYDTSMEVRVDIPGDSSTPLPFDEFVAVIDRGERPAESLLLALHADRVVGICTLVLASDRERAHTGLTGVVRDWRGRGIAAALKARQVEWCRTAGLRSIRTANHDDNAPMRAVNARAGFRDVFEFATLERPTVVDRGPAGT